MHCKICFTVFTISLLVLSTQSLRNRRLSRTVAEMSNLLRDLRESVPSARTTRSENSEEQQTTLSSSRSSVAGSIDYDSEDLPQPVRLTESDSDEPVNFTRMHEEAIELRKAQIRKAIINKLRLDRLPRPPVPNIVHRFPHHILNMDRMQMDSPAETHRDNYHAKIKTMLRFPQPGEPVCKASHLVLLSFKQFAQGRD